MQVPKRITASALAGVALVVAGGQGCSPGPVVDKVGDAFASVAGSLSLPLPVRLSPDQQARFDRMSPEQQESFHRMMRAYREFKAESAAAVEESNRNAVRTLYSHLTEDEFRQALLNNPDRTLRHR